MASFTQGNREGKIGHRCSRSAPQRYSRKEGRCERKRIVAGTTKYGGIGTEIALHCRAQRGG